MASSQASWQNGRTTQHPGLLFASNPPTIETMVLSDSQRGLCCVVGVCARRSIRKERDENKEESKRLMNRTIDLPPIPPSLACRAYIDLSGRAWKSSFLLLLLLLLLPFLLTVLHFPLCCCRASGALTSSCHSSSFFSLLSIHSHSSRRTPTACTHISIYILPSLPSSLFSSLLPS